MKKSLSRYQVLRLQIELNTPAPAVILVTSATSNDGSSLVAVGLADSLADAGHHVALVASSLKGTANRERQFDLRSLNDILGTRRNISDEVSAFVEESRKEFDFTIVEAPPLQVSRVAMAFAGAVAAIVLSIRLGRMRCPEDDLMMQALERAKACVLGVVGASEASIREFYANECADALRDDHAARPHPSRKPKPSVVTVP